MEGQVVLLAGKLPRPGTILDALSRLLAEDGIQLRLELPGSGASIDANAWPEDALIVHRGQTSEVLHQLTLLEAQDWSICNSAARSLEAQDRRAVLTKLEAAGLRVPRWQILAQWTDVLEVAARQTVVVKAADGALGRGTRVLVSNSAPLPRDAPFSGPYLVEQHIPNDGTDRKLYVAGPTCFGLLKGWPRRPDFLPRPFEVSEDLREIAHATGAATGLEIYGVDVVIGPEGPVVVDVNVFPGFRGVEGGAEAVAGHVRSRLRSGPR